MERSCKGKRLAKGKDSQGKRFASDFGKNSAVRARRGAGKKHVEQGLVAGAARALDRKQPALGNDAAMKRILARVAARFENAVARHDDHEGVAGNRLRDRMHGTGSPKARGDLA